MTTEELHRVLIELQFLIRELLGIWASLRPSMPPNLAKHRR
jgi:hypothetical protein